MGATFFRSAAAFRGWLEKHHATSAELIVGLHRQDSGRGGLTYAAALDEALCFGWIDGVRRRHDATSYTIRFTPRRPRSIWSRANLGHVDRLKKAGRMTPAGLRALDARDPRQTGVYSFEQRRAARLDPASARALRANPAAWNYFSAQTPSYRHTATWWVVSAKRADTRQRRLQILITCAVEQKPIPPLAQRSRP